MWNHAVWLKRHHFSFELWCSSIHHKSTYKAEIWKVENLSLYNKSLNVWVDPLHSYVPYSRHYFIYKISNSHESLVPLFPWCKMVFCFLVYLYFIPIYVLNIEVFICPSDIHIKKATEFVCWKTWLNIKIRLIDTRSYITVLFEIVTGIYQW
jgi:hypothetical protein